MIRVPVVSLIIGILFAVPGIAQEKPRPPEPPVAPVPPEAAPEQAVRVEKPAPPVRGARPGLLRVQVVIARSQGDKKIGSAPYSFLVSADGRPAKVRMGVEVPVPVTMIPPGEAKSPPVTSFQYRSVGTNIDCGAQALSDGSYQLRMGVENSSVYQGPDAPQPPQSTAAAASPPLGLDRPLFRSFNVDLNPVLRDGESVQTVASTDPVTGEVVKIDVTVSVVK
jgi:hypothetical protein